MSAWCSFKESIGNRVLVSKDDAIVCSKTVPEHAQRLVNVLDMFEKANLQLQPEKCISNGSSELPLSRDLKET
jgi:hypothetical protein